MVDFCISLAGASVINLLTFVAYLPNIHILVDIVALQCWNLLASQPQEGIGPTVYS